jgi:hypothetical protein
MIGYNRIKSQKIINEIYEKHLKSVGKEQNNK